MKHAEPVPSRAPLSFWRSLTLRQILTKGSAPLLVALALAATVAWAGRGPGADGGALEGAEPLPVATRRPVAVDGFVRRREYTGEVRARRTSHLGFDRAGRLASVLVDQGQAVDAHVPLAALDVGKLQADREAVAASRREADARLVELRAGPRAEVIAAAAETVADLEAQADFLGRMQERRQTLLEDEHIPAEEYEEISSRLTSTSARLRAAQDRLEELRRGTRPERIAGQEARLAALDAQILRLDLEIEDSTLKAPYAGRVLDRHVDEGSVVTPGHAVLTLVEDGVLEAWIGVPPQVALGLVRGEKHAVHIGTASFEATLLARLPETDLATRTQPVVLTLPASASTQAVPGQVARLELEEYVDASGFWVPASSLTRGVRGLWAVYGLDSEGEGPSRVSRHHVEVLHVEADRVLVRGTLDAGMRVVVGNTERIAPGQQVVSVQQGG